jgi:hypothetical protein
LHCVRERLVSQRTGMANQIRAFLLERGIAVGRDSASYAPNCLVSWPHLPMFFRWRRLDQRIEGLSEEIEVLARTLRASDGHAPNRKALCVGRYFEAVLDACLQCS